MKATILQKMRVIKLSALSCLLYSSFAVANNWPVVESRTANPNPTTTFQQGWISEPIPQTTEQPKARSTSEALQIDQRLNALQEEVQALRGMFEELQNQVQKLSQRPVTPAVSATPGANASAADSTTADPQKSLYQSAQRQLQDKQYDAATKTLQSLISQYPQGEYAANGYYWLGEVAFIQGRFKDAEQSFMTILSQFPSHPKVGDALFKLGLVADAQGNHPKAKQYFEQVMRQYPNSAAARLAQGRLQKMKQEGR